MNELNHLKHRFGLEEKGGSKKLENYEALRRLIIIVFLMLIPWRQAAASSPEDGVTARAFLLMDARTGKSFSKMIRTSGCPQQVLRRY
jgi:hypothetical protein